MKRPWTVDLPRQAVTDPAAGDLAAGGGDSGLERDVERAVIRFADKAEDFGVWGRWLHAFDLTTRVTGRISQNFADFFWKRPVPPDFEAQNSANDLNPSSTPSKFDSLNFPQAQVPGLQVEFQDFEQEQTEGAKGRA